MAAEGPSGDAENRAAAAIREADSGSNHEAGMDGDEDSVADQANQDTPPDSDPTDR